MHFHLVQVRSKTYLLGYLTTLLHLHYFASLTPRPVLFVAALQSALESRESSPSRGLQEDSGLNVSSHLTIDSEARKK